MINIRAQREADLRQFPKSMVNSIFSSPAISTTALVNGKNNSMRFQEPLALSVAFDA